MHLTLLRPGGEAACGNLNCLQHFQYSAANLRKGARGGRGGEKIWKGMQLDKKNLGNSQLRLENCKLVNLFGTMLMYDV